ncbi:hypothetical protein BJX62DRAFT_251714 [Aspergillus germanicus]
MKVLLTGGSGFVAAHYLASLLQHGHDVVFAVRSDEKGQRILAAHPSIPRERLSYTIVEDIAQPNAFSAAVQSIPPFDAVIHTASLFHYAAKDAQRDLIDPAVLGTTSLLDAVAAHTPSVKRVVITSSFAANYNPHGHPDVYTEAHWNPVTLEEAMRDRVQAYRASKTFAERAAWDFVQQQRHGEEALTVTLVTINPPLILGPLRDLAEGKWRDAGALPRTFALYWADVHDVALAHTRALECEQAANRRFIVTAGSMCNAQIASIVRDCLPEMRGLVPDSIELTSDLPSDLYGIDTAASREVLGLSYRSLPDCIVDNLRAFQDV